MRGPTYPITVALALMLVAPPSFAFAQMGERGPSRLEVQTPLRVPEAQTPPRQILPRQAPPHQTSPRTQTFGGHVYHGQLAWRDGRWHHTTRNGRDGWWWDVGGFWYFYPAQIEGPPDYVSDIDVPDEYVAEDTTIAPAAPAPPEPNYAVYYRPGDLTGARYQTLEECEQVKDHAGNVGVCVLK
jgi:hypothetical protein